MIVLVLVVWGSSRARRGRGDGPGWWRVGDDGENHESCATMEPEEQQTERVRARMQTVAVLEASQTIELFSRTVPLPANYRCHPRRWSIWNYRCHHQQHGKSIEMIGIDTAILQHPTSDGTYRDKQR